jgi:hypothetical protein
MCAVCGFSYLRWTFCAHCSVARLPDFSWHNIPKRGKYTKFPLNYQMAVKYNNLRFPFWGPPKITQIGISGLKIPIPPGNPALWPFSLSLSLYSSACCNSLLFVCTNVYKKNFSLKSILFHRILKTPRKFIGALFIKSYLKDLRARLPDGLFSNQKSQFG